MNHKNGRTAIRVDALGLFLAGLINTFLALFVAGVVLSPGSRAGQSNLILRAQWIAGHSLRWQSGWLFWFAVTLSFAWSFYALGRHLNVDVPWTSLSIGVALIAAAVDIVGVLVNMTVLPALAPAVVGASAETTAATQAIFNSMESLANALTNVAAFGLYSVAGLLLLPAGIATPNYSRWLVWLGSAEWGVATIATVLLIVVPNWATIPLLVSFALYAPWVWLSAVWILRGE